MNDTASCAQEDYGPGDENAEASIQKAIVKLWEGLCLIDDKRARTFVALAISRLSQIACKSDSGLPGRFS